MAVSKAVPESIKPKNDWIVKELMDAEGFRSKVYLDTAARPPVPTGGWGHADPKMIVDQWRPMNEWLQLFDSDFDAAVKGYDSLNLNLDDVRRGVLIMMIFNMGLHRLLKFKKMLANLRNGDMAAAAREGLVNSVGDGPSEWRSVTRDRAHRLMCALLSGIWVS